MFVISSAYSRLIVVVLLIQVSRKNALCFVFFALRFADLLLKHQTPPDGCRLRAALADSMKDEAGVVGEVVVALGGCWSLENEREGSFFCVNEEPRKTR